MIALVRLIGGRLARLLMRCREVAGRSIPAGMSRISRRWSIGQLMDEPAEGSTGHTDHVMMMMTGISFQFRP